MMGKGFQHRHGPCGHRDAERRHARDDLWPGESRGHGPRGGGHRRGGRLGRLFAHGDLHFVVLHLIAEKPRHGYELIKAVEDMTSGAYSPSPGTIYPALTMLEDQGYARAQTSDGTRKLYTLTDNGRAYLDTHQAGVAALLARIGQIGAEQGAAASPRVVRAVENLKLALRLRLSQGPLSDEQIQAVVDALDHATGQIERS